MMHLNKIPDRKDNAIPMSILKRGYQEDKYGYVETSEDDNSTPCSGMSESGSERKVSSQLMKQLPSRNLDDLIGGTTVMDSSVKYSKSLTRKDSVYKTMRIKSAAINSSHMKIPPEQVYELLTSDKEMSPDDMKNTLREMHQSLTLKRVIKARFRREDEVRKQREHFGWSTLMKYKIAMSWQHIKCDIQDLRYSLELWHGHVKTIQGHFGSGVASYFIFLRWLVYVNIFSCILTFLFIVLPQWLYESSDTLPSLGNYSAAAFSEYDLLTGSGWFSDSLMYYGHYTNETIETVNGLYYNMPLAYIFTIGVLTIVILVVLAYSLAKSYQQRYVDTSGGKKNVFADKVFCAWDYSIETAGAAHLRSCSIYNTMKETLSSELRIVNEDSCGVKILKWLMFLGVHIFVLSILGGTGYFVYFILESSFADDANMMQMTLALSVTAIAFVFHQILKLVTRIEQAYTKTTGVYRTMVRVVGLKIVILGTLLYFWFVTDIPQTSDEVRCFETQTGEEIYRLIIVNFIYTLLCVTIIGEYLRKLVYTHLFKWVGPPEFDVAYNTLDLIYYQTLVWVGTYFNPLLPSILLIIYILLFYEKRYSVAMNCQPSKKPWSATHAHTIFLCLAFLNFLLAAFAVGYAILLITPSMSCGPFRHRTKNYDIIKKLLHLGHFDTSFIMEMVEYVTSPGVVAAILTALCVVVYYLKAQAQGYAKMVNLIHEQLILEGKDKVFLLRLFDQALKKKKDDLRPGTSDVSKKGYVESENHQKEDVGGSRSELVNEVYKDYQHPGLSPNQPNNYNAKYNPGYMPAAVPTNEMTPDYSDSDSKDDSEGHLGNRSNLPYPNTASCLEVTEGQLEHKPSLHPPRSPLQSETSPNHHSKGDLPSPSRKIAQKYDGLFPLPVHQQGFQYLARGETPPRLSNSSDGRIASGRRRK